MSQSAIHKVHRIVVCCVDGSNSVGALERAMALGRVSAMAPPFAPSGILLPTLPECADTLLGTDEVPLTALPTATLPALPATADRTRKQEDLQR
jgi:hypothetical protein